MSSVLSAIPYRELEIKFKTTPPQMEALSYDRYVGWSNERASYHRQLTYYYDYGAPINNVWQDFVFASMNACLRTRKIDLTTARMLQKTDKEFGRYKQTFKPEDGFFTMNVAGIEIACVSRREYNTLVNCHAPDIKDLYRMAASHRQALRGSKADPNDLTNKLAVTPLSEYLRYLKRPSDLRVIGAMPYHRYDGEINYAGSRVAFCHDFGKIRTVDGREKPFTEFELEFIPEGSKTMDGFVQLAQMLVERYGLQIHITSKAQRVMAEVKENVVRGPDGRAGIIPFADAMRRPTSALIMGKIKEAYAWFETDLPTNDNRTAFSLMKAPVQAATLGT